MYPIPAPTTASTATPIGFLKNEADPSCGLIRRRLGRRLGLRQRRLARCRRLRNRRAQPRHGHRLADLVCQRGQRNADDEHDEHEHARRQSPRSGLLLHLTHLLHRGARARDMRPSSWIVGEYTPNALPPVDASPRPSNSLVCLKERSFLGVPVGPGSKIGNERIQESAEPVRLTRPRRDRRAWLNATASAITRLLWSIEQNNRRIARPGVARALSSQLRASR